MRIRGRVSWRGGRPQGSLQRLGKSATPIVHHTASFYGLTAKSTRAQEAAVLRNIQKFHRSLGWADIGYSHLICPSGRVYCGRGWYRVPAAAVGYNTGNWHVCLIGNFESKKPTPAALESLEQIVRRFRKRTGSKRKALGHYQVNPTACPGKYLKQTVRRLP